MRWWCTMQALVAPSKRLKNATTKSWLMSFRSESIFLQSKVSACVVLSFHRNRALDWKILSWSLLPQIDTVCLNLSRHEELSPNSIFLIKWSHFKLLSRCHLVSVARFTKPLSPRLIGSSETPCSACEINSAEKRPISLPPFIASSALARSSFPSNLLRARTRHFVKQGGNLKVYPPNLSWYNYIWGTQYALF